VKDWVIQLKKIIFIGFTCGLENEGSDAVVYTATKFGLRGAAHALRELLRKDGIAVSCISPESIATDVPYNEGPQAAIEKYMSGRMPVADILCVINIMINTSNASCVKEVHIPTLMDKDV
jgi:short-subunit dehydrogenase